LRAKSCHKLSQAILFDKMFGMNNKYQYKLDKPAEGKNRRVILRSTHFGGWDKPRIERVRGLKYRWFPLSEFKKIPGHWLDHGTVHIDNEGNGIIEIQPYKSEQNAIDELSVFCEDYGIEMSFYESDWAPGGAISIEFKKKKDVL